MSDPQLIMLALAVAAGGCAAGFIAGLFGVGGGILTVPILSSIFVIGAHVSPDAAVHAAVGTSLLTIAPTSITSFRMHYRRGAVDMDILKRWAGFMVLGAILGSLITQRLPGNVVSIAFGFLALFLASILAFRRQGTSEPNALVLATASRHARRMKVLPFGIGVISSIVGVGGGALTVPALVATNLPVHRAVGTASAVGFLVALPSIIILLCSGGSTDVMPPGTVGQVNLLAFAILAPATMLMAPIGARLAHTLSAVKLRRSFALLLTVMALKMITGALIH